MEDVEDILSIVMYSREELSCIPEGIRFVVNLS
jgi:hypothetical protein